MEGKVVFYQGEQDDIKFGFETADLLTVDAGNTTFSLWTLPTPDAPIAEAVPGFSIPHVMTGVSAGPSTKTLVQYRFDSTDVPPGDYEGKFLVIGTMGGLPVRIYGRCLVRVLAG